MNYIILLNILMLFFVRGILRSMNLKLTDCIVNPIGMFIVCFSFIYFLIPVLLEIYNFHRYQTDYEINTKLSACLYLVLFFLITLLFYQIFSDRGGKLPFLDYQRVEKSELKIFNFLLLSLFLVAAIIFLRYIRSINIGDFLKNRIILLKGMGYLSFFLTLIYYYIFLFFYVKQKRTFWAYSFMIFCTLLSFFIFAYKGSRFSIFISFLYIIAGIVCQRKGYLNAKLKRRFSAVAISLLVIFSVYGAIRGQLNKISASNIQKQVDVSTVITSQVFTVWGNADNLYWLIENPMKVKFSYGSTFTAGFLNVVPRSIWENKPLGGGPTLKNMIDPGSYDLGDEDISSVTTGLPIESYMNFGWASLLFIPPLYALLLLGLKRLYERSAGDVIWVLLSVHLTFSFCFFLLYGEFLGIIARAITGIPLFFLPKLIVSSKRIFLYKI